jgi:multiple antibiotic resistance protein
MLAMVNPVEAAAAFATLTSGRPPDEQAKIALSATIVGCAILLGFGFLGEALLHALGVSIQAFQIAGGLLLLKIAFNMVFAEKTDTETAAAEKTRAPANDPSVFPLAIPIITGPGALTAAVTLINHAHQDFAMADLAFVLVVLVVFALTYLAMRGAESLTKVLGPTGVDASGRLVGIIVAAIAVQMVVNGALQIIHPAAQ